MPYVDRMQKLRDIFKNASIKYTGKSYVVLIGVENQSDIHYAIPIKNMFYDVMAYGNQVKETAKKHRKDKDTTTSDEFLSGFTKEDKLIPVITITAVSYTHLTCCIPCRSYDYSGSICIYGP